MSDLRAMLGDDDYEATIDKAVETAERYFDTANYTHPREGVTRCEYGCGVQLIERTIEHVTACILEAVLPDLLDALEKAEGHRDSLAAKLDAAIDVAHLDRQQAWSAEVFGPAEVRGHRGVLDHIRKELVEIEAKPGDVTEWADLIILAFDGAWRSGHTPADTIAAIKTKQERNEARTWPDWRTADPNKAIEHVRALDEAVTGDE